MVVVAISGGAEGQLPPSCVSSLIPCAAYVNSTRSPPATCCDPLRQAVDADLQCLCGDGRDKGDAHRANWIGSSSFISLSLLFWCSAVGL
ncbi:unnamed protein product [Musa hybrid cultivar]